ncbi:MAG: TadE/TadG family type IV pilus assembly protein [Planctomycetota bacterium]
MRETRNNHRRRRKGSITLEAAMVFPLLLTIFFVTIEFSWMFYVRHTISNAAREGARVAIIPGSTTAEVNAAVESAVRRGGLNSASYSHALTSGGSAVGSLDSVAGGSQVTVEITAPWSQFSVFNSGFGVWGNDITAEATMRREG